VLAREQTALLARDSKKAEPCREYLERQASPGNEKKVDFFSSDFEQCEKIADVSE